jgi:hypothetical protein
MVRFLSGCLIVLALAAAATPPTSVELRARYGEPYVERFTVLTNVMVTVQYGADGRALSPEIDRGYWLLHSLFMHTSTPQDAAIEAGRMMITQATCGAIESGTYEGETVGRSYNACEEALEDLAIRGDTLQRTSAELRARYGNPDVERFRVRPDVALTAEYGEDGPACAMRIEPRHLFNRTPVDDPPATMAALTDVLDEVVPPEARGKKLGPGPSFWGACRGALPPTEYENVTVNVYYGLCDSTLTPRGLEVRFKRPACDSLQPRRIPELR